MAGSIIVASSGAGPGGSSTGSLIADLVAGVTTPISATNPLPVTGTIITTNASVGLNGAVAPTSATEIGTIVAGNLQGVSNANPMPVDGTAAAGAAATGNPVQVGAVFTEPPPTLTAGAIDPLQCDTAGNLFINATGRTASFAATQSAFTPLADPSVPFLVFQGSATKTIRIRHIKISWACTTGNAAPNVIRVRRYTAISGGTPAALTPVPFDINNAAATATVSQYTALPTTATPYNAGSISSEYMQWITSTVALVGPVPIQLDFGVNSDQALTLRGVGDFIGLEISTVAAAGALMTVRFTWTES